MAILNNNPLVGASGNQGGYNINNSLRFRSSASAYLNRTFGSTYTDKTKSTVSFWVKRGRLNVTNGQSIMWYNASGASGHITFAGAGAGGTLVNDCLNFSNRNATTGSGDYGFQTTQLFRDPSAWYHIIIVFDTGQATSTNRVKLYVNGTQVTAFVSTQYPSQNYQTTAFLGGNSAAHIIGYGATTGATEYFDGYLADFNFIDGQALTPSSFGETDTTTGVWKPKAYTGTYGTNGFYLKFSDIATTSGSNAGLGKDFSGNTNYWTTNNISVTSGTTYDAMTDSPTNTSATVANYAVISPIAGSTIGTIDNANLRFYYNGANWSRQISTIGMTTGKYYAEFTITQIGDNSWQAGVTSSIPTSDSSNQNGEISGSSFLNAYQSFSSGASVWDDTSRSSLGFTPVNGDVIGVTFDADTATVKYYRNGSQVGTTGGYVVNTIGSVWYFQMFSKSTDGTGSYGIVDANFGQRPFTYTPPTGFVALNTYNLPTSTIVKGNSVMDATLYTGNNTTNTITNAGGFKPDVVWVKNRSGGYGHIHVLVDSIRGGSNKLFPNLTNAQGTSSVAYSSLNSNGFTLENSGGANNDMNESGFSYVAWQWQAGQGSTSSNTSGSITSTVSVNANAGVSIVAYTGTGANATVGHGLGVAPRLIICKNRASATDWAVYHASFGNTGALRLNSTIANEVDSRYWNNTTPTSTVFTVGSSSTVNGSSNTQVAYCFAEIAGFSRFGSYVANASSDGPFIYTGFRPRWIMFKRITSATNWYVIDTSISPINASTSGLYPNTTAEVSTEGAVDILSNGFKCRVSSGAFNFPSGETFAYVAFAENPFKNALAR